MYQYCYMSTTLSKWGAVRMEKSLIEKCERHIAGNGEYDSVSDFVSQKVIVALEKTGVAN